MKAEYSIIINKSADDIYKFLRDFTNHPKFVGAMKSVEEVSDGEAREGKRYKIKLGMMGKSVELEYEIASLEENRFIKARALDGPIKNLEQRYLLNSQNGSTEVKLEFEGEPGGLGGMFSGFIKKQIDNQVKNDLENLKKLLEG